MKGDRFEDEQCSILEMALIYRNSADGCAAPLEPKYADRLRKWLQHRLDTWTDNTCATQGRIDHHAKHFIEVILLCISPRTHQILQVTPSPSVLGCEHGRKRGQM